MASTLQATASALSEPPQFDSKTSLPKRPHYLRNQIDTHLKSMSILTSCHRLDDAIHTRGEAYPAASLQLVTTMTGPGRYAHWYNRDKNVTGVTNHFLVGLKACSTR